MCSSFALTRSTISELCIALRELLALDTLGQDQRAQDADVVRSGGGRASAIVVMVR
jgi:hypothetical protein